MKKARNMFVLALVLLSVISIGSVAGTYAKYTSTKEISDKARVAKWMDFSADSTISFDLFDVSYNSGKIASNSTDNVIAPGASKIVPFTINVAADKAPEVAYKLSFSNGDSTFAEGLEAKIKFAVVDSADADLSTATWGSLSDAITALNNGETNNTYMPNAVASATKYLAWKWDYSVDETTDTSDTKLGTDALTSDLFAEIKLKVTATQAN